MMRWAALFVAAFLLAPATASAQRVEDTFFNSVIPSRVDHLIGFIPTTFAIHPAGQRVAPGFGWVWTPILRLRLVLYVRRLHVLVHLGVPGADGDIAVMGSAQDPCAATGD